MEKHRPIMVIEDDQAVRELIGEILRDAGHDVVECSNGVEALDRLDSVIPAAITLDLAMPAMDGIQFLRNLRIHPTLGKTPVVFVTAAPEALRMSMLPEGHVTIGKPFYIDQLLLAVGRALDNGQAKS